MPIVDKLIKDSYGRIFNFVEPPEFTFGKELQLHVMEPKPNAPLKSPRLFEETMQKAVLTLLDYVESKYDAHLLGTGMHPLLHLKTLESGARAQKTDLREAILDVYSSLTKSLRDNLPYF